MRGSVRYFKQLQPLGWANGERKYNKGEKEITFFKRNSRLHISSDAGGLDLFIFFFISLLHAEDITKLKTL